MISIMKNTFNLFRKNKEMIYLITVQPIMIFLLMSFLLPYTTTHSIVVSNEGVSEQAIRLERQLLGLDGLNVSKITTDEVNEKLSGGNAEIAIVIKDNADATSTPWVNMICAHDSEIEAAVELCIEDSLKSQTGELDLVSVNSVKKKGLSISNSLAFMIFKTLTAGNLLGALIIAERRNKMKDRILLSGIKKSSYLFGMSFVYLLFMMLGSLICYAVGLLLNFDFGMRNSLGFLLMLFVSNVLSVSIYVFFAAFLKKEDGLGFVGTFILMPMSLFAGVLFPFKFMPEIMQKIGSCFPQRWISLGIEKMQQSGSILSGWREALMVLVLSALLFIIGMICDSSQIKKRR